MTPDIRIRTTTVSQSSLLLKNLLDSVLGLAALLLFAPLLLGIAIWIKLDSKGTVFFRQNRVGLDGQSFRIWKFRTMVQDADRLGPTLTEHNDARITRVGKLLRRTSLDELPQLLNVLSGEMSLVGPRPEIPEMVASYSPEQLRALAMKPGITGMSQINGRDDLPIDIKLDYEVQYVDNYSLLLDLKIILKTIPALISGRGNRF